MDKKYSLIIVLGIILGLSLGVSLSMLNVKMSKNFFSVIEILLCITFFLMIVIIVASIRMNLKTLKLINNGEYQEAIRVLKKLHDKYKKNFKFKNLTLFNIANCYNRMGKFEDSIEYLQLIDIDKLDNFAKANYYGLYAQNLYFMGAEFEKAREYISISCERDSLPDSVLLNALIELEFDNVELSNKMIDKYFKLDFNKKFGIKNGMLWIYDDKFRKINENFMLGLYYFYKKDYKSSEKYALEAAKCTYYNFYSFKAKELLEKLTGK